MSDQKNMLIAIGLSLAILLGFQFFYEFPKMEKERERQAEIAAQEAADNPVPKTQSNQNTDIQAPGGGASAPSVQASVATAAQRAEALASSPRINIDTPTVYGSISLEGGRIDDLVLKNYGQDVGEDAERIHLLHPVGAPKSYYAEFGGVGSSNDLKLPGPNTRWKSNQTELAPGKPVTLSWDNQAGLLFERTYEIDDHYMITTIQRVTNSKKKSVGLFPYGLVARSGTPRTLGFYILHEGPLGVFDGTLREYDYDELQETRKVELSSTGGWIGITDKYWLAALIPDQKIGST